ncbi:MAG: thiamine-phosphate kinase [Thermodesulfovibrionales bacterium]
MVISKVGELALIAKLRALFEADDSRVVVPIGDDAAVIACGGANVAVTTDLMAEHVHFDYRYTTFYQVGFKLISANVSDLFAMGSTPAYAFLDIAVKKDRQEDDIDEFLRGVKEACELFSLKVLGGDLSASIGNDFYAATLIGHVQRPVTRSGALEGDRIFITGPTGESAAGLDVLKRLMQRIDFRGKPGPVLPELTDLKLAAVHRHLLPVPRSPVGVLDRANAMIDISDGLLIDLWRMCTASGRGAVIYEDRVPVSDAVRSIASELGRDPWSYVFGGGEDYELIISSAADRIEGCFCIGEITDNGFFIVDTKGRRRPCVAQGYEHFADKG